MKKIAVSLLAIIPILCFGKKDPMLPDSFLVVPGTSVCLTFNTSMVGELRKQDSVTWIFHSEGERSARSFAVKFKTSVQYKSDLFKDCVLFQPSIQACTRQKEQRFPGSNFFINPDLGDTEDRGHAVVPASIRFYTDTTGMKPTIAGGILSSEKFPEHKVPDYLRSFYFRKYEVTNAEYREFVNWVLDSIVRTRLGYVLPNGKLDRKKKVNIYEDSVGLKLNLFIPKGERFYSRLDINTRILNYRFRKSPEGFKFDTLNIYPDTSRWLSDFSFSFNEPMQNLYNWHPAYDRYPVVGVNYWQCLAFLEWKSLRLQNELAAKGIKCKVECQLPSEIEWDYASTAEKEKENVILAGRFYPGTCDASWMTDLLLFRNSSQDQTVLDSRDVRADSVADSIARTQVLTINQPRKSHPIFSFADDFDKPTRRFDLNEQKTWGDFIYDGYFHTGPVQILNDGFSKTKRGKLQQPNERTRAHYDEATGICWLDGNVSEWMREDLDKNWRGIFSKHLLVMDGPYAEEEKLIRSYEKYYYDKLPQHGKLVRGCNWYDERFAMKYGKNAGGTQAKTFCDPSEAHCTLGFRYVIYLENQ